jgi:hypothetical protein
MPEFPRTALPLAGRGLGEGLLLQSTREGPVVYDTWAQKMPDSQFILDRWWDWWPDIPAYPVPGVYNLWKKSCCRFAADGRA